MTALRWTIHEARCSIGGGDPEDFNVLESEIVIAKDGVALLELIREHRHKLREIITLHVNESAQESWSGQEQFLALKRLAELLI